MILRFQDWLIKEELIVFGDKAKSNVLSNVFTGDILKLKEFLQANLTDKDLVLIGSGEQGYAFKWKNSKPLTLEFTQNNFIGKDVQEGEKVIKITTNKHEASVAKENIKKFKSKEIPGLATYYWIKEIDLPKDKWWSTIYGPPEEEVFLRYPKSGYTSRMNLPKEKLAGIRFADFGKETKETLIRLLARMKKDRTLWIICLEELRMLSDKEKSLCKFLEQYSWLINENKETFDDKTVLELWEWLINKDSEARKILKTTFGRWIKGKIKAKWRDMFLYHDIKGQEVVEWWHKWTRLEEMSQLWGYSIEDAHLDNLGMRGDELVHFDIM